MDGRLLHRLLLGLSGLRLAAHTAQHTLDLLLAQDRPAGGLGRALGLRGGLRLRLGSGLGLGRRSALLRGDGAEVHFKARQQLSRQVHRHHIDKLTFQDVLNAQ